MSTSAGQNLPNTILDKIEETIRERSDRTFIVWHDQEGQIKKSYTFGHLYEEAGRIAEALLNTKTKTRILQRGDRVVLVYNFGLNFFAAFLACLRAGIVPVLVYPPSRPLSKSLPKLTKVLQLCNAKLVLADTDICLWRRTDKINPLSDSRRLWPAGTEFIDTTKLATRKSSGVLLKSAVINQDDLAFLQFTSGSTSEPKGILITHKALLANVNAIRRATTSDLQSHTGGLPDQITCCSWLPPYHDMGLIHKTISPFVNGYKVHMMSPLSFLRSPLLWIQIMSEHRVHLTVAPDFAYRLAAKRFNEAKAKGHPDTAFGLDLSNLCQLQSAAEPIRSDTKEIFEQAFGGFGLSRTWFGTGYGLGENVVFCTYVHGFRTSNLHRASDNSPPFVAVGQRGNPNNGVESIKIVNPGSNVEAPHGDTGELWVAGPSVAAGYLGQPDLTRQTFGATLKGDDIATKYLRTGDLAFFDEEGYLFICGRIKDLIIVNGVNYYPQDFENATVSTSVRPGCVAAFSRDESSHDGEVEIVFEIRSSAEARAVDVCKDVVAAVSSSCGIHPSRVVAISERSICKTTSGKIQRRACRAALHDDQLPIVFDWTPGSAKESFHVSPKMKENLLHLLVSHANNYPNHQVFTWVDDAGKESTSLNYVNLWKKSTAVMNLLKKKKTKAGERVVVAYPFGLEFLSGIFGAMLADCVPCSVYPPNPTKLATDMPRFQETVNDAGATLALTTTQFARKMKAASLMYKSGVSWLSTDRLTIASKVTIPTEYLVDDSEKPALIQYTSGSTNKPKGVILSHRCLYNNGKAITEAGNFSVETCSVCWAPQYHDLGLLVGFMTSLYSASRLYTFSPLVFIKNPLLWDRLVRRYQAHATIAPNFGYALLIKELHKANRKSDWSFIQRASLAAEPTTEVVVNGIHNELSVPLESIWNVYGMAECGVFITGGPTFSKDGVMSCGPVENSVSKIRIVNKDDEQLPEGEEGVIWVQSKLTASGYLNQSELTSKTFYNRVKEETGNWLNTGDLGKIIGSELFVCGREKEVIIIAGVNHYPTDIEAVVDGEFGHMLRQGRTAAFQFTFQSIGVVFEMQNEKVAAEELESLLLAVKQLIQQRAALEVGYLALLKRGSVPKTMSGKLKRTMIKKKSVAGDWRHDELLHLVGDKDPVSTPHATEPSPAKHAISFLGSAHGTGCPHATHGGLKDFYAKNKGQCYHHGSIAEYATTDADQIHAELKELDTAFPAGQIQRDPYEAGAFKFSDHRFWTEVREGDGPRRPRPFTLGNSYEEKLRVRSWIADLLQATPTREELKTSAATFLARHNVSRSFHTSSLEKWVVGTLYQWMFQEKATQAFIDDFVAYQWRVFDMVMKPFESKTDSSILKAKELYLHSFVANKGLSAEQASWAMDMLLFPGIQVTFLLRCGLGVQYSKVFLQQSYTISNENVFQFVWECIRMFPPFPALPWWRDGKRHLIVLAMCGMDQLHWGSDTHTFNPDRLTAQQFDERSTFFAEQSQLFRCPAKSFALQLASSFFLEFSKTGPWKSDTDIPFADVQPYFDNFVLKRAAKVVVVGGGVAGLTCALRLAQRGVHVTVVERNNMIGGHSRHATVLGGHIRNPAFGAFQVDQWPNAVAIMDELHVEKISHGKASSFATRFASDGHSIPSPPQSTIEAFFADMREVYTLGRSSKTIGQFLAEKGYGDTFLFGFFFGAIIHHYPGLTIKEYLEIPVHLVAWFSLGDSKLSGTVVYRVRCKEYMASFVDKLKSLSVSVRLECSAEVLSRNDQQCHLKMDGKEELFCDYLVLATPPNAAINILGQTSTSDDLLLRSFDCRKETVVLHQDPSWSDGSPLAVKLPNKDSQLPSRNDTLPMTTHILSDTDGTTPIYATYSYANFDSLPIQGEREHMTFTHVRITPSAEYLRSRLLENQGQNNTYFAGGWTRGLMLHEDAVVSGAKVANSILESLGERPFALLSRKIELPELISTVSLPTKVIPQQSEVVDSLKSSNIGQSERFELVLAKVFGYSFQLDQTWADIGLSSVMSVELGDAIAREFQITLPADWVTRCATVAQLKKYVLSHQTVPIPTDLPELKHIFSIPLPWPLFGFLQLIGCAIIVVLFAFPFVLAMYLEALLSEQGGTMALLYPLILQVWALTFSLTVIATKWVVIGKYTEGQISVSTFAYLRWWLVDRMFELWETFIGNYIVETPLLNLVYILAGGNIDPSVKLSGMVREMDLVTIKKGSSLSFCIRPHRFGVWENNMDSPVLRFRSVSVGKNCDVKGLLSLGTNLGDNVIVEFKAVLAEGSQVPADASVEGNLATITGAVEQSEPDPYPWWQIGFLKMMWQVVVLYLFFGALAASHFLVGAYVSSIFRYRTILAAVVDLTVGSVLVLLAVIPLKWTIIGKRHPGQYQDTLFRAMADYCVDYLYSTSLTFLDMHYTNSRLWNLYFKALGMDVDMRSKFFALSFTPSIADLVTMRDTFASTSHWETKKDGSYHKIEVNESSIGLEVTLRAGVSVSRAAIPPHTHVQQSVIREDPDDRNRVVALGQLFKEEVERFILMTIALGVTFASLIPSVEVWRVFSPNPATCALTTGFVLALVMAVHSMSMVILARALQFFVYFESSERSKPWSVSVYVSFEINYHWLIQKYSLLSLFSGGPLFNCYASFRGVKMDGQALFVGNLRFYDGHYVTIADRTIIDSSWVSGHFQIFHDLNLGKSKACGTLHPLTLVGCKSVAVTAETGPCKFVTDNASSDFKADVGFLF